MKLDCDPYSWFQGLVNLDVLSKKKNQKKNQVEINNVQGYVGKDMDHYSISIRIGRSHPPSPGRGKRTSFAPLYSTVGRVSRISKLESILLHCDSLLSN